MLNVLALYKINVQSVIVDMFFLVDHRAVFFLQKKNKKTARFLVVRVHSTVTYAWPDACAVI